ncbi:hypothetical protein [Methylobacterium nodulans]|uniref:Uncharacterized protein n=1 Tax=Methylobacterium nodulans (strain LMG 21967 / CNCM I-2342 / ORS 2060) TaxID=460265 RepID=B8I9R4_METNO|nr:hypothetical protein [Methylobacterium nodulans]ACL55317.1 conserved hypothetical protein [Methylobacterium nodulans ORS 2060]
MGEAARDEAWQDRAPDSSSLLRRLLLRPVPRLPAPPLDAGVEDIIDEEDLEEALSRLEAENLVIKAALKSERAEAAELRAQLESLSETETADDLRADRDRWATLVERLLFAGR